MHALSRAPASISSGAAGVGRTRAARRAPDAAEGGDLERARDHVHPTGWGYAACVKRSR